MPIFFEDGGSRHSPPPSIQPAGRVEQRGERTTHDTTTHDPFGDQIESNSIPLGPRSIKPRDAMYGNSDRGEFIEWLESGGSPGWSHTPVRPFSSDRYLELC